METATFAAGCFWGIQSAFDEVEGVVQTEVGYMGGSLQNPTYHDVCTDRTGHAEVVQVKFDPQRVSYDALLDTFWAIHDPTTMNRQGPDIGSQYRSAIFFYSPEQEQAARASIRKAQERFSRPIVTRLEPAAELWHAEEYHQKYNEKRGVKSCHF